MHINVFHISYYIQDMKRPKMSNADQWIKKLCPTYTSEYSETLCKEICAACCNMDGSYGKQK